MGVALGGIPAPTCSHTTPLFFLQHSSPFDQPRLPIPTRKHTPFAFLFFPPFPSLNQTVLCCLERNPSSPLPPSLPTSPYYLFPTPTPPTPPAHPDRTSLPGAHPGAGAAARPRQVLATFLPHHPVRRAPGGTRRRVHRLRIAARRVGGAAQQWRRWVVAGPFYSPQRCGWVARGLLVVHRSAGG